jgi:hypothetical protein
LSNACRIDKDHINEITMTDPKLDEADQERAFSPG